MRRGRAGGAAVLVLLVAGWLALAPAPVGGQVSYVTTRGTSMLPRFHSGDLAVLRPGRYAVGDVVGYRSATLGNTVVMHRIVAVDGGRYTFKGDHNTWLDPDHPTRAALIGKLWLHVPCGGLVLRSLTSPAVLACFAFLLVLAGAPRTRRRRRRRGASRMPAGLPPMGLGRRARSALPALAATAALALLVAGWASVRPGTLPGTAHIPYTQAVTFGYSAPGPAGPAYAGRPLVTGDPVFLRLVPTLQVSADYTFSSPSAAALTGSATMVADLALANGWHRTVPLAAARSFTGTTVHLSAALTPATLLALAAKVAAQTGVPAGSYTVSVGPDVQIAGRLSQHPVSATFSPRSSFTLDALQLTPTAGGAATPGQTGTLAVPATHPATVSALGHSMPLGRLRTWALGLALLAGAAAAAGYQLSRTGPADPQGAITSRYAALLVPVACDVEVPAGQVVDVESIDVLARIARKYDRLVLHQVRHGRHTYLVADDGCLYRYAPNPQPPAPALGTPHGPQGQPPPVPAQPTGPGWVEGDRSPAPTR